MADEKIGEVSVVISGDYSQLNADLTESQQVAAAGGAKIAQAFNAAGDAAGDVSKLSDALKALAANGIEFDTAAKLSEQDFQQMATAASAVVRPVENLDAALAAFVQQAGDKGKLDALNASLQDFGDSAGEILPAVQQVEQQSGSLLKTLVAFAGIDLSIQALKSFAADALEAYASVEKATVAITALTGSVGAAQQAIGQIKELAIQDALSFPTLLTAEQRMLSFGLSAQQVRGALQSVADTSAATGIGLNVVAQSFERTSESGALNSRTLVQLGINMHDLATALGVVDSQASAAFKALDQAGRLEALEAATSKFAGTAGKVADTLSGQWQNLLTQIQFSEQELGQALAPLASGLIAAASATVKNADDIIKAFGDVSTAAVKLGDDLKQVGAYLKATDPNETAVIQGFLKFTDSMSASEKQALSITSTFNLMTLPLKAVSLGLNLITGAFDVLAAIAPNVNALTAALVTNLDNLTHSSTTSGKAFQDAWKDSNSVADGISKIVDEQSKANSTVDVAKRTYDALSASLTAQKPLLDGHVATIQEVNRAHAALDAAVAASNVTIGDHSAAIKGIEDDYKGWAAALADPAGKIQGLMQTLSAANAAYAGVTQTTIGSIKDQAAAFGAWAVDAGKAQRAAEDDAGSMDVLNGAISRTVSFAKDLGNATVVVTSALSPLGQEVQRLKQHYDELNVSFKTQTEMEDGHIAKLQQVESAYRAWQKAVSDQNTALGQLGNTVSTVGALIDAMGTIIHTVTVTGVQDIDLLAGSAAGLVQQLESLNSAWQSFASSVGSFSPGGSGSLTGQKLGTFGGYSGTPNEMIQQFNALTSGGSDFVNGQYSDVQAFFVQMQAHLLQQAIQAWQIANPGKDWSGSAVGAGGGSSASSTPALPPSPSPAPSGTLPTMVLYGDQTAQITSALTAVATSLSGGSDSVASAANIAAEALDSSSSSSLASAARATADALSSSASSAVAALTGGVSDELAAVQQRIAEDQARGDADSLLDDQMVLARTKEIAALTDEQKARFNSTADFYGLNSALEQWTTNVTGMGPALDNLSQSAQSAASSLTSLNNGLSDELGAVQQRIAEDQARGDTDSLLDDQMVLARTKEIAALTDEQKARFNSTADFYGLNSALEQWTTNVTGMGPALDNLSQSAQSAASSLTSLNNGLSDELGAVQQRIAEDQARGDADSLLDDQMVLARTKEIAALTDEQKARFNSTADFYGLNSALEQWTTNVTGMGMGTAAPAAPVAMPTSNALEPPPPSDWSVIANLPRSSTVYNVTIMNPTISSQSQSDYLVSQLRDLGVR